VIYSYNSQQPTDSDVAVVAFYGFDYSEERVKACLERSLDWFKSLGFNEGGLGYRKAGKLRQISKLTPKKAGRFTFDEVTHFNLFAVAESSELVWYDFNLATGFDGEYASRCNNAYIAAFHTIATIGCDSLSDVARDFVTILEPGYGIGFLLPQILGPISYVHGFTAGPADYVAVGEEYEEEVRICRWPDVGLENEVYRHGIIRDVYPLNYLNKSQLERPVNGIPLQAWIEQEARRGSIEKFSDGLWLWTVPRDEIPEIRRILKASDAVFNYKLYLDK
jgi:hypothetical protein